MSEEQSFATAAHAHFRAWLAAQGPELPRVNRSHQYSGSHRPYFGIRNPQLHGAVRDWLRAQPGLTRDQWLATLDALYGLGEAASEVAAIEERLLAGRLLNRANRLRRQAGFPLGRLRAWLGQLEGWVEIDSTCQATFSLAELASAANINLQRAALVLPIGALRETPMEPRLLPLALELVRRVNAQPSVQLERDKRVVKALSWLLREACKQYAPQITEFLAGEGEALPAVVRRETRIKLEHGVKNPRRRA